MTTTYFDGIDNLKDLKALYKKLVLKFHPDKFLREDKKEWAREIMKVINTEYEAVMEYIKKYGKAPNGQKKHGPGRTKNGMTPEMKEALEKISDLQGIEIEICGSWIWVSGDTKPNKGALKEAGFRWAPKKMQWYWRAEEDKKKKKGNLTMEQIREKYGSEQVKSYATRRRLTA